MSYRALLSEAEVSKWRESFPILDKCTHLVSCSQAPQSVQVRAAIDGYLDNWAQHGMDWEGWVDEVVRAKASFAKFIGADVSEIAVSSCVSDAVSNIAGALSYDKKNKVVLTDAEFPTVQYVWLAHQKHGAKLDFVPVGGDHTIALDEYEKHIDENTLITSIPQVYYLNGFKQDISEIAKIAHKKGSLFLVDAYQCLGTEPIDVKKLDIDILVSGSLKYLLGIPGIAFTYVRRELFSQLFPSNTGWFGQSNPFLFQTRYLDYAPDARRLDTGTPPVLAAYAARAGIDLLLDVGAEKIKDRIDMLSGVCIKGALERGLHLISPTDVSKKAASTAIQVTPQISSHNMEVLLNEQKILCSARGDVIRLAPHFFNRPDEIITALDAIKDILKRS